MVCGQLLRIPALNEKCSRIPHIGCQQLPLPVDCVKEGYNSCGTTFAAAHTSFPEATPETRFWRQELFVCLQAFYKLQAAQLDSKPTKAKKMSPAIMMHCRYCW